MTAAHHSITSPKCVASELSPKLEFARGWKLECSASCGGLAGAMSVGIAQGAALAGPGAGAALLRTTGAVVSRKKKRKNKK